METMVRRFVNKNIYDTGLPVLTKRNDFDVNLAGFSYNYLKNQYKLSIYSQLIFKDNYSISLIDNKLIILISEAKEYNKPVYIHNYNWKNSGTETYERIRSLDILLPGDDFYIIRHYMIPEKSILNIILSTSS